MIPQISCIGWIPKGACKPIPDQYDAPDDADIEALIEQQESLSLEQLKGSIDSLSKSEDAPEIGMDLGDDAESGDDASDTELKEGDDILKALKMDQYDDEEIDEDDLMDRFVGHAQGLDPALDPFLDGGSDLDDEDIEENLIRETDSCILVGGTGDNESTIEVYLYDESTSNLYVHHEFVVPAFPLCVQWLNANPKPTPDADGVVQTTGSFAAVGSFLPGIEIWNVDIMNPLEPTCILGGYESQQDKALLDALDEAANSSTKKSKKGKKKTEIKPKLKPNSHSDAVMCLAWHQAIPTRLASGSADTTIKLWDVTTQQCVETLRRHKDKVQSIEWNPTEHFILLSGSYDRTVSVGDVRAPTQGMSFKLSSDVEVVKWDPHHPFLFVTSTENGEVVCRDIRKNNPNEKPLWSVKAHSKAASSLSFNSVIPNVFATASVDKSIKIWDSNGASVPSCIATRDLGVGQIFSMSFDRSSPFVLAAGGNEGCLALWDIMENAEINRRYGKDAEKLGFGSQDLPEDYVKMQAKGIQGKGIGPGTDGKKGDVGDDESDDDRAGFMTMGNGMGDNDEE